MSSCLHAHTYTHMHVCCADFPTGLPAWVFLPHAWVAMSRLRLVLMFWNKQSRRFSVFSLGAASPAAVGQLSTPMKPLWEYIVNQVFSIDYTQPTATLLDRGGNIQFGGKFKWQSDIKCHQQRISPVFAVSHLRLDTVRDVGHSQQQKLL